MDEKVFWNLISRINSQKLAEGREDQALLPLAKHFKTLAEADLFEFEEALSRYLYELDGTVYAQNAGESSDSGDAFLYARCYVVAMGKTYYEDVKANPGQMPKSLDNWCEPLLYAHREAWARLTKNSQQDWPYISSVSYESFSNRRAWNHLR
ncbi:DUF4240 domain-containing protein [Iodobacter fluviatilis]|uniref:Uncharacterized protein DUF4240 n=1 Tax=Iodobacter fluviatilis TaxID=537 RepID=A0A377Q8B6_9NEIS|nr:DUF4240 domain-containing protein [Iodobacter fluviatilis]TCU88806.1 uncharacterized protein DUF4240 [Iodobacter fluviatilis]STQ91122.1 Uncharacterised protein [Iodobacter fluviatilis]